MMADDTVMEEREELMVSPISGEVHYRNGHFLKPSAATAVAAPSAAASCKGLPLKLKFSTWGCRSPKWSAWVEQMRSSHHSTWKTAGILDAIVSTTYPIRRCEDLILALSEKWSPPTNSFVFPWGEASITLEDMMALGAYSVLGDPVFTPPADAETAYKVNKLLESRLELYKNPARRACRSRWMTKFMGSGTEIEHEAFLAYWLSGFVFSFSCNTIRKIVIPIAVRLARGIRIALAPPVLASIYRAFTLLKKAVVKIAVSAPLALVQVWAWERLALLRPNPKRVGENEPRIARWVGTHRDIRSSTAIDSNFNFRWRPYCKEVVGSEEELESFGRCVRVSKLVGVEKGCVEQYLPHRVSMQFGMDQDLPGHVSAPGEEVDREIAWADYIRPVGDAEAVFAAHGTHEPCVTSRYSKWWKKQVISEQLNVDDLPLRAWMRHCMGATKNAKSAFKRTKRQYLQLFRRQRNLGCASIPQTHSAANANANASESSDKSPAKHFVSSVKSLEGYEKSSEKLMSAPLEACELGSGREIEGNVEFQREICLFSAVRNEGSSETLMPATREASELGIGVEIEGNQGENCLFQAVIDRESSENLAPAPVEASESGGGCEIEGKQGENCLFQATSNKQSPEKLMHAPILEACGRGIEGNVKFRGENCLLLAISNEERKHAQMEAFESGSGCEIEGKLKENVVQLSEAKIDLDKVGEKVRIVEEILRQISEGRLVCHIISQKKKKKKKETMEE